MSFSLNGSVSGGTFNNVKGNMTQIFNSVQVPSNTEFEVESDQNDGVRPYSSLLAMSGHLVGATQVSRRASRQNRGPYRDHRSLNMPLEHGGNSHGGDDVPPYLSQQTNANGVWLDIPYHSHQLADSALEHGHGGSSSVAIPYDDHWINTFLETESVVPNYSSQPTHRMVHNFAGHHVQPPGGLQSSNTFSIQGNMTQLHLTSHGNSGLDVLYRSIAMSAGHDSAEHFPEPACHPGTRASILKDLHSWSLETNTQSTLLWLYGSAGMGKSAIAQTFAGECTAAGRLGASFFFKRGDSERGTWNRLFTTLAYQLAHSVPGLSFPVQYAIEMDGLIVAKAIELQFQKLIVEPFKQTPGRPITPVLIVDGLDECEDYRMQQKILQLIINAVQFHDLPLRVLISSRPEPHIREVIGAPAAPIICRHFKLSADQSAYEDIRRYLRDKLSIVHSDRLTQGIDLGPNWPAPHVLDDLVSKSSGTFIYAITVIDFISDQYAHPGTQLASVLSLDPKSTAPLDDLYTQVLSVVPQEDQTLRILHAVWQEACLDPENIDILLSIPKGTSRFILRGLHSLLEIPLMTTPGGFTQPIHFRHASFHDFLGDPHRSTGWCMSLPWLKKDFFHSVAHLLSTPLPPLATSLQDIYINAVFWLAQELSAAIPDDYLFGILRDPVLQNNLFLATGHIWPKKGSMYPLDIEQLFEDLDFSSTLLIYNMPFSTNQGSPTCQFDPLYREVLATSPDLLLVLSVKTLFRDSYNSSVHGIERLFGLTHRLVYRPLLALRQKLIVPFPEGDSLLDFLLDPERAGALYLDRQVLSLDLLYRCIHGVKHFLNGKDIFVHWNVLTLITYCPLDPQLLRELESLNISKTCEIASSNRLLHESFHYYLLDGGGFNRILDWLQKFPEPPSEITQFWEKQLDSNMVGTEIVPAVH
ncbi:hypothetical protein GGX14DRAFT_545322 [Mycena pura]|uniref:Nephrocystin 3-like N-terminal domain-containing protein n=1 Tax=Mycena pura TaxID=153505 RepID=A0AAD6Y439_9AGAR|nr:hypothetical protein GGX14DRAFT_545322 [Mycena pura]